MKVAIFGGSFDPVHSEHVRLVQAAIEALKLDKVLVMPSCIAPHKRSGARTSGKERLEMCKIAFRDLPEVEVSDYELSQEGTSYSYLTCRWLKKQYPNAERFFLVGADMLESFFHWRDPDDILKNVTLAACGRGEDSVAPLHEKFRARFGCDFVEVPFTGKAVSSTEIHVALNFQFFTEVRGLEALDEKVYEYIMEDRLYQYPEQMQALELEKPERRAHSYRVALMACRRARSLEIAEKSAFLAAALHDCGKYVMLESHMLAGLQLSDGVPAPVVHQFSGAYLAEHNFGITDEDILNAIRYHTSGRPYMSPLEKLIFLADLLEEGRDFEGVDALRTLFWEDLDKCLLKALEQQIEYLESTEKPVYPLTKLAYLWIFSCESLKK